ncbi:MAG TPA: aminoacyl-tRNA hydrolase [Firmicutes bacterium]|nr:aminoacyl-tRNA hydrolase [Candidatus Fermentithermobacillaceae bacterium]
MRCIVGLGNPGKRYENTRHNSGFMVVERLAGRLGVSWDSSLRYALVAAVPAGAWGEGFLLARPLLFMNESGKALASLSLDRLIHPWEFIVVHDDMDIPFGFVRIKRNGSSGGHRGVESIISCLGTEEFLRVKVGIGRPPKNVEPRDYVLSPFEENPCAVEELLDKAADACLDVLTLGVDLAMNRHNCRIAPRDSGASEEGNEEPFKNAGGI